MNAYVLIVQALSAGIALGVFILLFSLLTDALRRR